jgi:hypothetical protein
LHKNSENGSNQTIKAESSLDKKHVPVKQKSIKLDLSNKINDDVPADQTLTKNNVDQNNENDSDNISIQESNENKNNVNKNEQNNVSIKYNVDETEHESNSRDEEENSRDKEFKKNFKAYIEKKDDREIIVDNIQEMYAKIINDERDLVAKNNADTYLRNENKLVKEITNLTIELEISKNTEIKKGLNTLIENLMELRKTLYNEYKQMVNINGLQQLQDLNLDEYRENARNLIDPSTYGLKNLFGDSDDESFLNENSDDNTDMNEESESDQNEKNIDNDENVISKNALKAFIIHQRDLVAENNAAKKYLQKELYKRIINNEYKFEINSSDHQIKCKFSLPHNLVLKTTTSFDCSMNEHYNKLKMTLKNFENKNGMHYNYEIQFQDTNTETYFEGKIMDFEEFVYAEDQKKISFFIKERSFTVQKI